jgi:AhpD family alkylhydroperoxidase
MNGSTETAPRVRLMTEADAPLSVHDRFARGDPGPITASLANVPELLQVSVPFIGRALGGVTVSPRTAELVIVRSSALLRCRYCTLTHAAVALDVGVAPAEVRALCDLTRPPLAVAAEDRESVLLTWVDEVAAGRDEVPDEIADAMAVAYDDATVVELAVMIGCTIFLNRYCTALRLPVGAGSLATIGAAGIDPEELLR